MQDEFKNREVRVTEAPHFIPCQRVCSDIPRPLQISLTFIPWEDQPHPLEAFWPPYSYLQAAPRSSHNTWIVGGQVNFSAVSHEIHTLLHSH